LQSAFVLYRKAEHHAKKAPGGYRIWTYPWSARLIAPKKHVPDLNRRRLPPNVEKASSFSLCISNEIYCRFNATFLHRNFPSRGVASTLPFCRLDIHSEEVEPQRENMVVFSDGS
jgi:hypothetical protein